MRHLLAALLVFSVAVTVHGQEAKKPIRLPGVEADGSVRLPNSWSIKPAGKQIELGDFPVRMALHPSGKWAAILHAGYGPHEIIIVDLSKKKERVTSRVVLEQTFDGIAFVGNGDKLYVGGGEFDTLHTFDFADGLLSKHRTTKVADDKFIPGSLAVNGDMVYVPGVFGHAVAILGPKVGKDRAMVPLEKDSYPFACLVDDKNEFLYVSLWAKSAVVVIDVAKKKVVKTLATENHPTEMAFGPGEKTLFVACSNSTRVSVIDLKDGKGLETINCALYPSAPNGNTPNSLCLTGDGKILFVANADNNNIAVFNVEKPGNAKPMGFIPVAMYPTAVRFDKFTKRILVTNGRGATVRANPNGPDPKLPKNPTIREYIAGLYRGTLSIIDMPDEMEMLQYSKQAYQCSPARETPDRKAPSDDNPIPHLFQSKMVFSTTLPGKTKKGPISPDVVFEFMANGRNFVPISEFRIKAAEVQEFADLNGIKGDRLTKEQFLDYYSWAVARDIAKNSPIKYCIYVIRENRTYDQVFGDIKEGNGAPRLCIFPEKITPNAHKLARQFVLLDNFYCDGEVSAEGHEWSMGAYCTDFVKRVWPLSYRGSPTKKLSIYPAEGNFDEVARPAGGYLWDRCAEAKVSYRSYGEWISNGKTLKDPGKARVKALEGHFDPWFRGYDLEYPDNKRTDRFIEELKRFEKEGDMPRLQIVRLPNDHTYGTKAGKPTPTAMVAENDLALGRFIEAISKSKFWKETAIFVIEDDAQNGSDHVDAHRTVALCISPYTQTGKVDSTMYSTASMLRTMELILGLRPMSQFDAAATPMYNAFTAKPNFAEYTHAVPDADMKAKNLSTAWGAKLSETFDFADADLADDLLFNEVIWRSVRGANSPMPPPVRAAFVFPHLPSEK
ncbi:MAG TPA: bifunctional YncE family protein/alkaline phosphatase family protein [Gemmataceae bacterium]|nr:bifunctional YncE family protein/alkaline phosphatase family protein [Gemmataceae bacterium]